MENPIGYFSSLTDPRVERTREQCLEDILFIADVTFKEDASRARNGYAAENLSSLRKIALQIIYDQQDKLSLKKRRRKAAYDLNYLNQLLST
jgi:predicted transposase YbfD/YdcC